MPSSTRKSAVIGIEGMSCDHCRRAVEQGLGQLEGVFRVAVDLGKKQAEVNFDPQTVSLDDIKGKIVELGYQV